MVTPEGINWLNKISLAQHQAIVYVTFKFKSLILGGYG